VRSRPAARAAGLLTCGRLQSRSTFRLLLLPREFTDAAFFNQWTEYAAGAWTCTLRMVFRFFMQIPDPDGSRLIGLGLGLGHFHLSFVPIGIYPLCNRSIQGSLHWCPRRDGIVGTAWSYACCYFWQARIPGYLRKVVGCVSLPLHYCYRSSWGLCDQHRAEPTDDGCRGSVSA
jgi:hypothetical protein